MIASIWANSHVSMQAPMRAAFGASELEDAYTVARVSMMQSRNAVLCLLLHLILLCTTDTAAFNAPVAFRHGRLLRRCPTEIAFA
jgi:hypothetical protein